jgi:hypothetical protein
MGYTFVLSRFGLSLRDVLLFLSLVEPNMCQLLEVDLRLYERTRVIVRAVHLLGSYVPS